MRHHSDSDPRDALHDYLDTLVGTPPPDSRAGNLDPELRNDVDRFFDLTERAGMVPGDTRRPTMNVTLPVSTALPTPQRRRRTRGGVTLPAWARHLNVISTGMLIVAVIAFVFVAFDSNDSGNNGTGDGPNLNGAVPIATVPDDAETSSIPYPTADECTVEVTREELIADIQEANVATEPERQMYERAIEPSDEARQTIMQTFREWQACAWDTQGYGFAYQIQLQTPWFTANSLPVFYNSSKGAIERPISQETIEAYADVLLQPEEAATPPVIVEAGTPLSMAEEESAGQVPFPPDATPAVVEEGRSFPTIFAEDIVITGPDTAIAQAHFVNERTREVTSITPLTFGFVEVDGQWLIDSYSEGGGG